MSAMAGILCLDGCPVDHQALECMIRALSHRAPDGTATWSHGFVGMAQGMFRTTPEPLHTVHPLADERGLWVLTADARIDNRDELMAVLGISGCDPATVTDHALLLRAYQRWGERCPERLLGDFAFAIWDEQAQRLFCARDHFGVKPLYYFHGQAEQLFVFASEIKAILCLPQVPRQLNRVKVADYLASVPDTCSTIYEGVRRLPPAHTMVVDRNGVRLQTYWSLDASRTLRLGSEQEYAEAFRDVFEAAVRSRLRRSVPLGASLSGGLDSSSITCVARQMLRREGYVLPTYSGIFDEVTECDERPYIHAVVDQGFLAPSYVQADQQGPLTHLDDMHRYQDEPFFAPGSFLNWQICQVARAQGTRILLNGFDGDSVVSHGMGYLDELARSGRWYTLAMEVKALGRTQGISSRQWLWSYARHYRLEPMFARHRMLAIPRRLFCSLLRKTKVANPPSSHPPAWRRIVQPDFARETHLDERFRSWMQGQPRPGQDEKERHYRALTSSLQPYGLEVLDKLFASFSIEPRYPFWDRRLVEFALSLPADQKLHRGRTRMVLRRAMAGILPTQVQWRSDKMNFFPNFVHGLLHYGKSRLDEVVNGRMEAMAGYIDISALRELYRGFASGTDRNPTEVYTMWRAVSLALWLQSSELTP